MAPMLAQVIPMHSPIRLLASRQEAAEVLGISVRTIDLLAERGELHAIRLGTRKLFAWEELRRVAGVGGSMTREAAR